MNLIRFSYPSFISVFTFYLILPLHSIAQIEEAPIVLNQTEQSSNEMLYVLIVLFSFALTAIAYLIFRLRKSTVLNKQMKEQEEELIGSNDQYLEIFDFSLASIITTDPEGVVTNLYLAAEEMLGYSAKELIGKNIKTIYASEDNFIKVIDYLRKYDQFGGEILNKRRKGHNHRTIGYPAQFGGERGKKFGKPRLHDLLRNEAKLSMTELSDLLSKELDYWQGENNQVDDITILGVEVY